VIVLDTNVVSELTKPNPERKVQDWMNNWQLESSDRPFLTAVSKTELYYGIQILPPGKRRDILGAATHLAITKYFAGHILPFDNNAADLCAQIMSQRRKAGKPIYLADAQIAAIALSQSATLATRNTRDFQDLGLSLINPWELPG
jgi:toxin FitB